MTHLFDEAQERLRADGLDLDEVERLALAANDQTAADLVTELLAEKPDGADHGDFRHSAGRRSQIGRRSRGF